MSLFSKTKKYRKPSRDIDEKVKSLNKELEKTGLIVEVGPANSTKHVYNTYIYHPATDMEFSDVPDPSGVRAAGWTQPSNGYDASDSSTWANAFPNTDWLYNPNEVGGETNKPVVTSADTPPTGQTIGRFGPGGGLIRTHVAHGSALGYLKSDNTYQGILWASYWGGMYEPTESNRYGSGAPYRGYTDAEYSFMQSAYSKMQASTFNIDVKFWYPYSYFWYGNWDTYGGTKKESGGSRWVLVNGSIAGNPNTYQSQDNAPPYHEVLNRYQTGDPDYYPGNVGPFLDWLRKALDVSKEALDWLMGKAGEVVDAAQDAVDQFMNELEGNESTLPPKVKDFIQDTKDSSLAQAVVDNILEPFREKIAEKKVTPAAFNFFNYVTNSLPAELDNDYLNFLEDGYVDDVISNGHIQDDGTFYAGENIVGTAQVPREDGDYVEIDFNMGFKNNIEEFEDKEVTLVQQALYDFLGPYSADAQTFTGIIPLDLFAGAVLGQLIDNAKSLGGAQDKPGTLRISKEKLKELNSTMYSMLVNDGIITEGVSLSEGWVSPKHTDVDKDEKKRWFNPKDIQPEYPNDPPPEIVNGYSEKMLPKLDTPIPYIQVKRKDLIRAHKLKKHEAQEYVDLVNKLNDYIKRNPDRLAYLRERYPTSDPRLAELNYKMDMQIAASDEYLDKQFPENQRLFGKLMQATKRSIALTDPKTYKDKKGKMTSYKKLLRVDHVVSEYSIKERDIKNRKIGYGGKKKSVSKLLNKPIKKTNNMFGSLDVSDMKKTTVKKVNEKKIQETKLITDKKYIQDQMNNLRSDWKKELNLNERMTTTGVLQYQLYGSSDDHVVMQTGFTGDGDINDFDINTGSHGGGDFQMGDHRGGEFTAMTNFTDMADVDDPTGQFGKTVRGFRGVDENGDPDLSPTTSEHPNGTSDGDDLQWPGSTGGFRGVSMRGSYNSSPWTATGGPTNENAVGFEEQEEPQQGILARGIGSAIIFGSTGNPGVPRLAALKAVDTSEMDTFSMNWFTMGHIFVDHVSSSPTYGQTFTRDDFKPTAKGDDIVLFYWCGDKEGAQSYGEPMSSYGSKHQDGWRPINRKPDGTLVDSVDPAIIPWKPNPVDENGDRIARGGQYAGPYRGNTFYNAKVHLPEWCRAKNQRFLIVQNQINGGGYAYSRFGITSIRFQRRAPMSVAIPLDSPEASSFVRLGQSPNERTSPKQRKKKVENILKASKSYVNKVVGDPFPGTGAKIGEAQGTNEKPYVPHQWNDKRKEFGDVGTLDQQKDKFVSKDVKLAPNYAQAQKQINKKKSKK